MFASTDFPDHASSFYTADRERRATWLRLRADWPVRIASSNLPARKWRRAPTVASHVADLHEVINVHAGSSHPALLGASWGAMLALAYAAARSGSTGPLILVGCGTFDLAARAELQRTIAERMNDDIRGRLKRADQLHQDERLK